MATAVEGEVIVDQEIKSEALALIDQANAIKVTSAEEYRQACEFGRELASRIKRAENYFANLVEPAHTAWKRLVSARDAVLNPLEAAKKHVSQLAANWQIEERKRAEAQAEAERQKAIKEEEDRKLNQAATLAAEGRLEEAEQVISEPTIPVPVVANTTAAVPKVNGASKARVRYKVRVTSLQLLVKAIAEGKVPVTCVTPDLSALNRMAEAMKGQLNYPGCEVYSEAGVSFRS